MLPPRTALSPDAAPSPPPTTRDTARRRTRWTLPRRLAAVLLVLVFFESALALLALRFLRVHFGEFSTAQIAFHVARMGEGFRHLTTVRHNAWPLLAVAAGLTVCYGWMVVRAFGGRDFGRWRASFVSVVLAGVAGAGVYLQAAWITEGEARYFMKFVLGQKDESAYFDTRYRTVNADDVTFPRGKRNMVLVLFESLEASLSDPSVYPEPILPRWPSIRAEGVHFAGHRQCEGTEWSIAGLVAYLFGIPLLTAEGPFEHNHFGEQAERFLPGASSLPAVLEAHGYDVVVFMACDGAFAGNEKLFTTHLQRPQVFDVNRLRATDPALVDDRLHAWGVYDDYLFERVRQYLDDRDPARPFLLIVKTVGTHAIGRTVSPGGAQRWGDFRDSFLDTDRLTADFIAWGRSRPFARDTVFAVMGDHLVINRDGPGLEGIPPMAEGSVDNVFIHPDLPAPPPGSGGGPRVFASWDMAPTLLEALGADFPDGRFGLGVSLFRDTPTLFEQGEFEEYQREMGANHPRYNEFLYPGLFAQP